MIKKRNKALEYEKRKRCTSGVGTIEIQVPISLGEILMPISLGEILMPISLGEILMPISLGEILVPISLVKTKTR